MRRAELERLLAKHGLRRRANEVLAKGRPTQYGTNAGQKSGQGIVIKKVTHVRSFIEGGLMAFDLLKQEAELRKMRG